MLPDYYEFHNTVKILSGINALENIPYELQGMHARRPMILSGPVLKKIGMLQKVLDAVSSEQVNPGGMFTDIPADSSVEVVNRIGRAYQEAHCDSILAIGGGSVLDTAKGVKMLISQEVEDLMELQGCAAMTRGRTVPFIVVPTTAGSGSEVTQVAVIKHIEKTMKMEFVSGYLLPDVAVLDARMTETMPKRTTAATGLDALCHAVEAYSCMQKNPLSDAYATAAIDLIRENLERAVADGSDREARLAMANASLMAGVSFSNSMVGLVHAIGHALGGVCKVSHGDAMAILLPHCMKYNYARASENYAQLLLPLAGAEVYAATPREKRGKEAIRAVRGLQRRLHRMCGLPMWLQEVQVDKKDFDAVAKQAINDGAMLTNPRKAGYDDVMAILEKAYTHV